MIDVIKTPDAPSGYPSAENASISLPLTPMSAPNQASSKQADVPEANNVNSVPVVANESLKLTGAN
jgi:hypothetical protein